MPENMRGAAAIVGIGELKPERTRPGRSVYSLLTEAAYLAIQDAGLKKEDIDSFVMDAGMEGAAFEWNLPGPYGRASGKSIVRPTPLCARATADKPLR